MDEWLDDDRVPWLAGLATVAFGLLNVAHARFDEWIATQWLFTYEHGFVRRGLPGHLLQTVAQPNEAIIFAVGVLIATCVVGATAGVVVVALRRRDTRLVRLAVIAALLGSASGFPFLAASAGRLEHINVLLVIGAAVAVRAWRCGWVAAALAGVGAAVVHEASVVLLWPWLAAFTAHYRRPWLPVLIVPAAATVAVLLAPAPLALSQMMTELSATADFAVIEGAVLPLYRTTAENIGFVVDSLLSVYGLWLPLSILAAAPLAAFAWWLLRGVQEARPMVLASLVPAGMSLIGVDFGRWFAFMSILLAVTAATHAPKGVRHSGLAVGVIGVLLASVASGGTDYTGYRALFDAITFTL